MYIAMNRFKIAPGRENEFEDIWRQRESNLSEVPGFQQFNLLRGNSSDDHTLFATHVIWEDEESFKDWTNSDQFRKSHAKAGNATTQGLYLGPPCFEGFEAVL
ncbi:MAG: antibiotic biosynthesis monooxygenase [Halieaceae bacterium]|jgi:heme-degrading monooxygenase HmoA|nr:antibiotic biosynthesis monooxygenase [Halieaceae bacterium]